MTIDAVLFDADGVIQRPTVDWRAALSGFVSPGDAEEFVLDLMTSERPSLVGKGDFRDAVAEALRRWHSEVPVEAVLDLWRRFEAEPVVVDLIRQLRANGIDLGLAKPDPAYFRTILQAIDRPATSVLFIDDNVANVDGARSVGLHAEVYDLAEGTDALRSLLIRYGLPVSA